MMNGYTRSLQSIIDLAFDIPAPNSITPQIVMIAQALQNVDVINEAADERERSELQAKYAAVVAELECASKDIELRDREIAALKRKLDMIDVNDVLDVQILESKLKAEAIREAVECCDEYCLENDMSGDVGISKFDLLSYADKLEADQ